MGDQWVDPNVTPMTPSRPFTTDIPMQIHRIPDDDSSIQNSQPSIKSNTNSSASKASQELEAFLNQSVHLDPEAIISRPIWNRATSTPVGNYVDERAGDDDLSKSYFVTGQAPSVQGSPQGQIPPMRSPQGQPAPQRPIRPPSPFPRSMLGQRPAAGQPSRFNFPGAVPIPSFPNPGAVQVRIPTVPYPGSMQGQRSPIPVSAPQWYRNTSTPQGPYVDANEQQDLSQSYYLAGQAPFEYPTQQSSPNPQSDPNWSQVSPDLSSFEETSGEFIGGEQFNFSQAEQVPFQGQMSQPPANQSPASFPNVSDHDSFLPKLSTYTNEILKEFQESMASDLRNLLQGQVERLVDEMTKPEMLQEVLNVILPTLFDKALEEMTEESVHLVIQSALGENTLEQVLPMMAKGQVACNKACNCPGNPDLPEMDADIDSSGTRSLPTLNPGSRAERPLTPGSRAERPLTSDSRTERPLTSGSRGERPLTSDSRTERPLTPGSRSERPLTSDSRAERPLTPTNRPKSHGKRSSTAANRPKSLRKRSLTPKGRNFPEDRREDYCNSGQIDCAEFGFPCVSGERITRSRSRPRSRGRHSEDDEDSDRCPCMS